MVCLLSLCSTDKELLPLRYTKLDVENITLILGFSLSSVLWCKQSSTWPQVCTDHYLINMAASRPEVFSQAFSSLACLLSNGDPLRSNAFKYRDSSYATLVCQQQ